MTVPWWLLLLVAPGSLWLSFRLVTMDEEPVSGMPEWALVALDEIEGLPETLEPVA